MEIKAINKFFVNSYIFMEGHQKFEELEIDTVRNIEPVTVYLSTRRMNKLSICVVIVSSNWINRGSFICNYQLE